MSNLATLLTCLFIGLKLTEHIDWSWWVVLTPVWVWLWLVVMVCLFGAVSGATQSMPRTPRRW